MQGITKEKYSDPGFHNCYRKHSFFACIDRKRGHDEIQLDGFKAYHSPRTELRNGKSLQCAEGGVVLFVAEDIADSYFVKVHSTEVFPEVAAVEFLGSFFGLENNVIICDHNNHIYFMLKFRCKQALFRNTSYFQNNGPRGLHTCPTNGWV